MKNYYSLSISRTISQVIMRVHKPVAYKLALLEKPKGASWCIIIKTINNLTSINWITLPIIANTKTRQESFKNFIKNQ